MDYTYNNPKHPHAPSTIAGLPYLAGTIGVKSRSYEYDGNGNPIAYSEPRSFRSMLWDEENRLRGLNDNGKLHLYSYDHTGERTVKSSAETSMTMINGAASAVITHTDDYTAYVSPYFVVNKGKFTKHFFEGRSRIVSKLGEGTFVHKNNGITAGGVDYLALSRKMQEARDNYIRSLNTPPGPPTQQGIYASPAYTGQPYPSIDWQEISQNQPPPNGWPRPPRFNDPGDVPGPPVQFGPPVTNDNVRAGYGFVPNGVEEKNLYYYHPDHLGSSSYITDKEGRVVQHTEYMAFGEVLFDEHLVSPKMPYLFNGKELDYETGLYYYGARYYDPKTSIFLNVDPLVEKTGTPYAYVNNNPIRYIDPTGMEAEDHIDVTKNKDGTYTVVGGQANKDKNIYLVDSNGKRTGEVLGKMLTEYSFHNEKGNAIVGAKIDLRDKSGQNFIDNEIKNIGLLEYISNAKGKEPLDFKHRGMDNKDSNISVEQHHYRGMPFNGKIASARDVGNYAAGYVAGVKGLSWESARSGFDALETKQANGWNLFNWIGNWKREGQPTQQAERAGFDAGRMLYLNRRPSIRDDVHRIDMIYNNPKF